jgi:uncharacterized membrane protein
VGINDNFMKDLAATMTPNSSTLFVLVRKSTPDKVLEELTGTGGRILKTSLSGSTAPNHSSVGRFVDALDGCIQNGVILLVGLLE